VTTELVTADLLVANVTLGTKDPPSTVTLHAAIFAGASG
jgi:hypothetical protein